MPAVPRKPAKRLRSPEAQPKERSPPQPPPEQALPRPGPFPPTKPPPQWLIQECFQWGSHGFALPPPPAPPPAKEPLPPWRVRD